MATPNNEMYTIDDKDGDVFSDEGQQQAAPPARPPLSEEELIQQQNAHQELRRKHIQERLQQQKDERQQQQLLGDVPLHVETQIPLPPQQQQQGENNNGATTAVNPTHAIDSYFDSDGSSDTGSDFDGGNIVSDDVFGDEYDSDEEYGNTNETTNNGTRAPIPVYVIVLSILTGILIILGMTMALIASNSNVSNTMAAINERRLQEVYDYLLAHKYIDYENIATYENSPQVLAAKWIATIDTARVAIPKLTETYVSTDKNHYGDEILFSDKETTTSEILGYDFLTRYVMAVFYYEMNGHNGVWVHDLNFLSHNPVCHWYQLIIFVDEIDQINTALLENTEYVQELINKNQIKPIGISCSQDYVVDGIFIDGNNLTGTLPTELALLSNLQVLNLDSNNIVGDIPTSFSKLSNLEHLYLGSNALWGTIPEWIDQLSQLNALILDHNLLSGPLPTTLKNMMQLESLALDDNFLTGTVTHVFGENYDDNPALITNNIIIKHILLEKNFLEESIDEKFLYGLYNLEILDISNNKFFGYLPKHFFDNDVSTDLRIIDASNNNITHFLKLSKDNTKLEFLALQNNFITGGYNITRSIRFLHSLKHLDLSDNSLTSLLSSDIDNETPLFDKTGRDDNSSFSKTETSFFGVLSDNQTIHDHILDAISDLDNNNFENNAPIVSNFFDLNLEYLFLANNPFEPGPIPYDFISLFDSLEELSLKNTKRTGTIPDYFGQNLKKLVLLDLDNNELTGTIPTSLGLLSDTLQFLLLNQNKLDGTIPAEALSNLTNLRLSFFEDNNLTGDLDPIYCDGTNKKGRDNQDDSDRTPNNNLPYVIADCAASNKQVQCSCCDLCCGGTEDDADGNSVDSSSYNCNPNDYVPNLYPQWQYGYNRSFYLFGDRVGFFGD